jgi:hypothetical protein
LGCGDLSPLSFAIQLAKHHGFRSADGSEIEIDDKSLHSKLKNSPRPQKKKLDHGERSSFKLG